jgi:hypothetical protein
MRRGVWLFFLAALLASACSHSIVHTDSVSGCGVVSPAVAAKIRQQLPVETNLDDGCWCWALPSRNRLEGTYFTKSNDVRHNLDTYVFEYREGQWALTETRYELVMWHERQLR